MIKLKTLFSTPRRIPVVLSLAGLLAAAVLAGCGSGGSSTITVGNENSARTTRSSTRPRKKKNRAKRAPTRRKRRPTGPLSKKPVVTSPGGTPPKKEVIKDLIVGTGAEAKAGQSVTVNYVGINWKSGKEFDSSWKRNEPFSSRSGRNR